MRLLGNRVATVVANRVRPAPKVADPFYQSAEWIALRDRVRREADGMCQSPSCNRTGYIVDHKIEIRDGGAKLDRANLMLLCSPCHGMKTARARAARAAR